VDGLRRIRRSCEPGSPESGCLDALADGLSLSRLYRLAADDADKAVMFPIATPLALKLGRDLVPQGQSTLRGDLTDLRERVERDTGVHVPIVRVIPDGSIGPGDYAILIDGTPVAWGSIPPNVRQREPGALVIRHLEATVRSGLASFIGLDDVQAWLDRSHDTDPVLARTSLPDRSSRALLSRVMQALASEGVPLTDRNALLQAMQETPQGAGAFEVAAAARQQLRARLPGNAPGTRQVFVPASLEERMAAGLHRESGSTYWELPRDESAALSQELRALGAGSPDQPVALVVSASRLRPFVWRLLAPAPSSASVLSKGELRDGDGSAEAGAPGAPGDPATAT